jgi:hypothetical protein
MQRAPLLLLTACTSSLNWHAGGHAGGSSGAGPTASTSSGDAWQRFAVQHIELGTAFDKVPDMTCGPDPASQGYSTYRHTCVRFLDERCAGRPSKIHHIRSTADLPGGQSCFMDEGSGATYLDRKHQVPELFSIAVVATDTRAPRVYEIAYTFPKDLLTPDSKLGQALIAKYGTPSSTTPPIRMSWTAGNVRLDAACGATEGPQGELCTLTVGDTDLLDSERAKQKAADEAAEKRNAPPPPQL